MSIQIYDLVNTNLLRRALLRLFVRRSFPVSIQIFDLSSRIFTVCIFDLDIELAQENTSCTAFEKEFTKKHTSNNYRKNS